MNRVQRAIVAALTVAAFNLSISSAVMAQSTVYTDGLTESQRAQVELEVAKMKEAPKDTVNVSEGVRKEAEEWGQLGSNMGKAIVSAAKEIGVAANEFAQTPLGKITVAVIVFKLIGVQLLHICIGTLILLFGWVSTFYLLAFTKFCGNDVEYEYKPVLWGAWQRRLKTRFREEDGATFTRLSIALVVFVITTMWGTGAIFL